MGSVLMTGRRYYGQGKWYPGEPLPRWKFACYWRKDGEDMWKDASLFADPNKNYQLTNDDGLLFLRTLTEALSINEHDIQPTYEDPFYFL